MKKYIAVTALALILSAAAFGTAEARQAKDQTIVPPAPERSVNKGNPQHGCHGANTPGAWRLIQLHGKAASCYCAGAADEALPNSCCPGQPPEPCRRNDKKDHGQ